MFPWSDLVTSSQYLNPELLLFQLWWITSLWSYQRNSSLVYLIPSSLFLQNLQYSSLLYLSIYTDIHCVDSYILFHEPLHFPVPLTGDVYSQYSLYSPSMTSGPLSSALCPHLSFGITIACVTKSSTLPSSHLLSNIWGSWTYSLLWIIFLNGFWDTAFLRFVMYCLGHSFLVSFIDISFNSHQNPGTTPELNIQTSSTLYLHCLPWWSHLRLWC